MERYTIPRGIKVKETIVYGLNGKQIIYLAFGVGGALGVASLPIPIDFKIAGSILSAICSLLLSITKRHGQDLDQYVWNTVKYPIRQKEWNNDVAEKPKSIIIHYHSKQPSTA